LGDINISTANILIYLDHYFAVRKATNTGGAERNAKARAYFNSEIRI
jgi:hypothetical protein